MGLAENFAAGGQSALSGLARVPGAALDFWDAQIARPVLNTVFGEKNVNRFNDAADEAILRGIGGLYETLGLTEKGSTERDIQWAREHPDAPGLLEETANALAASAQETLFSPPPPRTIR